MQKNNTDLRSWPAYTLAETARYLKVTNAFLRSWVVGHPNLKGDGVTHFQPLIHPVPRQPAMLSFWNLIEAHVLRSLRTDRGVSIKALRQSVAHVEKSLKVENLLLNKELQTRAGIVFLEHYGGLIELSASGRLAMRRRFDEHLKRIEWDNRKCPVRLYPYVSAETTATRLIAIDPSMAFGRPIVLRAGVSTAAIAERIDTGETVADLAEDYDLKSEEIEEAVLYERAA